MKIYSDLNIGTEVVDEDSDGIFYLNEMHGWKRRPTTIVVQDKYQGLSQRAVAQRRTSMNTETLMTDLWRKKGGLTDADGTAERHRDFLVRSG